MKRIDGVTMSDAEARAQRGIKFERDVTISDRQRMRKVLKNSFSQEELKTISGRNKLTIGVAGVSDKHSGYYKPGRGSARAVVEDPRQADTVIHEVVHHLRRVDKSRTGAAKAHSGPAIGPRAKRRIQNHEEAATVAETAARAVRTRRPSGYYDDVPAVRRGKLTPNAAYKEDRALMTGGKGPAVGKTAVAAVNKNLGKTHISRKRLGLTEGVAAYSLMNKKPRK